MDKDALLRDIVKDLQLFVNSLQSLIEETPSKPVITLDEVREVLAEKSRQGHTAAIRALLEQHGAAKLSQIDPSKYASLLTAVAELP